MESRIDALANWWDHYWTDTVYPYCVGKDGVVLDQNATRVPKECLCMEELADNKVHVLYEDDEVLPYTGDSSAPVYVPWLWIGHVPSDTDLTRTLQKYLIPGNHILLDLLMYVLGKDTDEGFMYLDAKTLQLRKFPVEGIRIETQDDAVSTR